MPVGELSFPVLKFALQAVFSFVVAIFVMVMLARGAEVGVYLPVLTGIVGYWLPNPSLHRKRTVET